MSQEQAEGLVPAPFSARPLAASNFLKIYSSCPKGTDEDPLTCEDITKHMIDTVKAKYMSCYKAHHDDLWAASVKFWTGEFYGPVQAALISDNAGLLQHWVALVRLINNWVLRNPLRLSLTCRRRSHMTLQDAAAVREHTTYRTAMYTACCYGIEWKDISLSVGSMFVRWVFEVPEGCVQCADISTCSQYPDENEVLIVPYSAVYIERKEEADTDTNPDGKLVTIYARVLPDSREIDHALPVTLT
eukprot:TRINITY_DN28784_c0_g1_i1.p1 TRINITY_DN28784_c0_g1~~TRINITY_DN28784_c0_g1_i1.p1  ORF type:complete len:245 (+),score=45.83 TRINITY_DN28784_c0_g1_i1:179-913(+)